MTQENSLRKRVLLSVQRALVGEITPEMRKISVEWSDEEIKLWVYHDGKIESEKIEDFDASVLTEIVANFPYPDKSDPEIKFEFVQVDFPQKVESKGLPVYARKEN